MQLILSFIAGLVLASIVAYFLSKDSISRIQAEYNAYREITESSKLERELQIQKQIELLQSQFEATSQKLLKERQEELSKNNRETVGQLLTPIQEQMKEVRELMDKTRKDNNQSTSSLEGALKAMLQQTTQISQDANHLADALKNRGKVHGDWGEQVLEDILAGSGLREGEEFTRQESFRGEKGSELRPDVVIHCSDGKRVIVDSKVSLTAYSDALGAENDMERQDAIKRNYDSVKKHVKELADKQYPKYVDNAMNYVLMFIPNEGAYVMAMNFDHSLAQDAFRMGVVIVNPTNLMLTLHLILQTWQQTRQEDNCKKILTVATGLHDKVIGLVNTTRSLQRQLETVNNTFSDMHTQLESGTGNVLKRVEDLRDLGVLSTKRPKTRKTIDTESALPILTENSDE